MKGLKPLDISIGSVIIKSEYSNNMQCRDYSPPCLFFIFYGQLSLYSHFGSWNWGSEEFCGTPVEPLARIPIYKKKELASSTRMLNDMANKTPSAHFCEQATIFSKPVVYC